MQSQLTKLKISGRFCLFSGTFEVDILSKFVLVGIGRNARFGRKYVRNI